MSYTGTVERTVGEFRHYLKGKAVTATELSNALIKESEQMRDLITNARKLNRPVATFERRLLEVNKEIGLVSAVLMQKLKKSNPAPKRAKTKETKMAKKEMKKAPAKAAKAAPTAPAPDTSMAGQVRYVAGSKDEFVVTQRIGNWIYATGKKDKKNHRIREDLALTERPAESKDNKAS